MKGVTPAQMKQYLSSIAAVHVPNYYRSEFVDWDNGRTRISNVREQLPKSFSRISQSDKIKPQKGSKSSDFTKTLSASEQESLMQILLSNPYIANEAELSILVNEKICQIGLVNAA